jgi:hypothetical protein
MEVKLDMMKKDLQSSSEIDRSQVGRIMPPFNCIIEKGEIRRFAEAIGDLNPLYLDETYAHLQGYRSVIAPPTFPVCIRLPDDPPWIVGLDRTRVLAGEQTFLYSRPIVAGDILSCQLHFVSVEDKHGSLGNMEILTQDLRGVDVQGNIIFTHRRLSIVREKASTLRT